MILFDHPTQFITITNLNWLPILKSDFHKKIVIEALQTRVYKQEVTIYAFVIMPNHLHIIWLLHDGMIRADFQRDFLKFTARSILNCMRMNDNPFIQLLKVKTTDRNYQVWERNALSIDLYSEKVLIQKLNYIHNNPIKPKWRLSELPEKYRYSSAAFYETGITEFDWLTHWRG